MTPDDEPRSAAGGMVTTTVRFDTDLWTEIEYHAERLGLPRAAFIRDAARERVARTTHHTSHLPSADDLMQLTRRVERIERILTRPRRQPSA